MHLPVETTAKYKPAWKTTIFDKQSPWLHGHMAVLTKVKKHNIKNRFS